MSAAQRPGTRRGLAIAARPLKPPLIAGPLQSDSNRTEGCGKADAAVGDVQHDGGKFEWLVARRRQQFVNLAPAHLAMHQPAAQPHAARDDPVDFEASVPLHAHLDLGEAGRDVRLLRIADHEIADLLGPETHAVQMVAGLDAAPLKLALQIMRGDRLAFDPDGGNGEKQQDENAQRKEARDAPPARTAADGQYLLLNGSLGHGAY